MNSTFLPRSLLVAAIALGTGAFTGPASAQAVDAAAAEALAEKSKCLKCHAVDKKKDGPSYKQVAAKYKGKADAEAKIYKHVTSSPKIKIDDVEEEHAMVKSKNEPEVRNLVRWILSR